jgi:hypothetical protein
VYAVEQERPRLDADGYDARCARGPRPTVDRSTAPHDAIATEFTGDAALARERWARVT